MQRQVEAQGALVLVVALAVLGPQALALLALQVMLLVLGAKLLQVVRC